MIAIFCFVVGALLALMGIGAYIYITGKGYNRHD